MDGPALDSAKERAVSEPTPGPWYWDDFNTHEGKSWADGLTGSCDRAVLHTELDVCCCCDCYQSCSIEMSPADAALIKGAPNLLKAATAALSDLEAELQDHYRYCTADGNVEYPSVPLLRAAIAAAREATS